MITQVQYYHNLPRGQPKGNGDSVLWLGVLEARGIGG